MTIATGRTRELDIAKICQRAYQLCALANEAQNISADKLSFAKDFLEMTLDDLETRGLRARAVAFEDIPLFTGVGEYTLKADVIDIVGECMFVPLDSSQPKTPVVAISREDWQLKPEQYTRGRPLQYFSDRSNSPVKVFLWPTPSVAENLGSLRMQVHRLAADSNDASKTMDLERYWGLCITYRLAQHIAAANALNPGRIQYFMTVADKYEENCKSYSAQKTQSRFVAAHSTGWNRR